MILIKKILFYGIVYTFAVTAFNFFTADKPQKNLDWGFEKAHAHPGPPGHGHDPSPSPGPGSMR